MIIALIVGAVLLLISLICGLHSVGSFFRGLAFRTPEPHTEDLAKAAAFSGALGIVILLFDLVAFICSKL